MPARFPPHPITRSVLEDSTVRRASQLRQTLTMRNLMLTSCVAMLLDLATALPPIEAHSRRASSGCGAFHLVNGITLPHFITSSNKSRSYFLHTPSGYDTNKPYPVVFGFHGSSSIGLFFEVDTGMSDSKYSGQVSPPSSQSSHNIRYRLEMLMSW
jgi:hypothetical protein